MSIEVYNGSSWVTVPDPQINDGSSWQQVQQGQVYDGSSWQTFYNRFSGSTTAPSLSLNSSTLYSITVNVTMNTTPPSGYSARVVVWNDTVGALTAQYVPSSSGTTGTISGTYSSSGLSINTPYQFAAYTEYLQGGTVVATSSTVYFSTSTRNVVLPSISVVSKTTDSVTVNVQHNDTLSKRVVVYRSSTPSTQYIPGSTTWTTANVSQNVTFSSLSPNIRYFFYVYVIYEESTTNTATVSTFTTTKYLSRVYAPASGYASANESTYFSSYALDATSYDSASTAPAYASDNSTSTSWESEPTEQVPTYGSAYKSISAIYKSGTTVNFYSPSHGFSTSYLSYGSLGATVSYLTHPISSAYYDTKVSNYVVVTLNGTPPINFSNGNTFTITGSTASNLNKTYSVYSHSAGSTTVYLNPNSNTSGTYGNNGTALLYAGTGGSITRLGGTYYSATVVNSDNIQVYDPDYTQNVSLAVCSGALTYTYPTGTTTQKKPQGSGQYENLYIAVRPNLPTGATSVRLEGLRFYSRYASPDINVYINTAYGPFYNSSVSDNSGPYSITNLATTYTIAPTSTSLGISNCWAFNFYIDRNSSSSSSMREVEFQYSYQTEIDPGD